FFSSRRRHTRLVSDWSSDVCSSDLFAEAGELDGAESVGIVAFGSIAAGVFWPVGGIRPEGGGLGPFVARTRAVAPIVLVGEAAAGPANHAGVNALQGIQQRFAKPMDVGDGRVFADPDAVIHDAAQMLDEE